jgi:exonuclease III
VYPAKLVLDKQVIRDEFPDWFSILGKNRLITMSSIDPLVNGTQQQSSVHRQNDQSSIPMFNFSMSDSRQSTLEPNTRIFQFSAAQSQSSLSSTVNERPSTQSLAMTSSSKAAPNTNQSTGSHNISEHAPSTARKPRSLTRSDGARQRVHSSVVTSRERIASNRMASKNANPSTTVNFSQSQANRSQRTKSTNSSLAATIINIANASSVKTQSASKTKSGDVPRPQIPASSMDPASVTPTEVKTPNVSLQAESLDPVV